MDEGKTLARRSIHPGRVVDLGVETVELPGGEVVDLEIVRHPGAAVVVPVHDDGRVALVRQYRHAVRGWLLEAPAGKLDGAEAPEVCARRELEEETGLRCERLESLGAIWPTPGFADERIRIYLARGLSEGEASPETHEVLSVVTLPFEEALTMALDGAIEDAKTVCALARAGRRLAAPSSRGDADR